MKSRSITEYLGIATIFLFVVPVTLWTVVNAAIWAHGMLVLPTLVY